MSLEPLLTIGEVAARIDVTTPTLRFYEDKGLIVSSRTAGGQRRYSRDVLRRVAFIRAAQRVGMSLGEIQESLGSLPVDRAPTVEEWERLAAQWQPRLNEQIALLEGLRDRLGKCIGCGCQTLDSCEVFNPNDAAGADGPGPRYLSSP